MSVTASFGVNYKKAFSDPSTSDSGVPLPAKINDVGSGIEGQFVFVQANGAIAQYAWCVIGSDGQAVEMTTTNATSANLQVGVAQVALADNQYGWLWVGGVRGGGVGSGIRGKAAASYVALANLNTTATAGVADDASTTLIKNVVGLSTLVGAGTVELRSNGPIVVN